MSSDELRENATYVEAKEVPESPPEASGQPASPTKLEPPEDAQVIRIWRDDEGKVIIDDAEMGPGPTLDMLHWATITMMMPFFYRELTGEFIKILQSTQIRLARAMISHEEKFHGRDPKGPHQTETPTSGAVPPPAPAGGSDNAPTPSADSPA